MVQMGAAGSGLPSSHLLAVLETYFCYNKVAVSVTCSGRYFAGVGEAGFVTFTDHNLRDAFLLSLLASVPDNLT